MTWPQAQLEKDIWQQYIFYLIYTCICVGMVLTSQCPEASYLQMPPLKIKMIMNIQTALKIICTGFREVTLPTQQKESAQLRCMKHTSLITRQIYTYLMHYINKKWKNLVTHDCKHHIIKKKIQKMQFKKTWNYKYKQYIQYTANIYMGFLYQTVWCSLEGQDPLGLTLAPLIRSVIYPGICELH